MKILVLGHKGMLGRTVLKYFAQQPQYETFTTKTRWGEDGFGEKIFTIAPDFIINCIGKIPQKKPTEGEYEFLNIKLPRFLETLGIKVIHPSTDCEFKGDIAPTEAYTKESIRDADDEYGLSKATISKEIQDTYINTKIIRVSIIGHEENTSVSLLDWFLSQKGSVRGYTNHYWNGITTLEWAKQCKTIMESWNDHPTLNQLGTDTHYSKYQILEIAKSVYQKDIDIIPFETDISVNKCMISDKELSELPLQLKELRAFLLTN